MNLLRGILINPWKKEISEVQTERDIHAWYKLLHCDCLCVAHIGSTIQGALSLDIWLDDNGLLQEPVPPRFKVEGYPHPLCGYGLVLCSDSGGETVSLPEMLTREVFVLTQHPGFEQWEQRMEPIDYPEHMI
jgi:hypothetical protein